MAIARRQGTPGVVGGLSAAINLTFPAPPVVGNGVIVLATIQGSGLALQPGDCRDNRGNTYSVAVILSSSGCNAVVFVCGSIAATGSPFTVTVQPSAAGFSVTGNAIEADQPIQVDKTVTNGGVSTTPSTGTTPALTKQDELLVAVVSGNSNEASIAVGGTWTQEYENLTATGNLSAGEGDSLILSAGQGTTQSASWTWPTNAIFAAALAAFIAAPLVTGSLFVRPGPALVGTSLFVTLANKTFSGTSVWLGLGA